MLRPEGKRARPRELRRLSLMCVGPLLVHEAVLRRVAEYLGRFSRAVERRFEVVDRRGRAPVVVVGEMRLQRQADVGGVGDIINQSISSCTFLLTGRISSDSEGR